jgi:pimeloyl-[acyl-carrier protein] synthase
VEGVARQGVFFALQEPEHVLDPYPLYHQLRSTSPFSWDFVLCGWILTGYADVKAALVDPRLTTDKFPWDVSQLPPGLPEQLAPLGRAIKRQVLYKDPPEHERLRRPLNRAFHPAVLERLRPSLEMLADELMDRGQRRGEMDIVSDYAEPLADHLMGELLGLPHDDRAWFIAACDQIREFRSSRRMGQETVRRGNRAVNHFGTVRDYVRTLIEARRDGSTDDVIGRSLAVEAGEDPPTEDEILANCVFFVNAGARNTAAAITNAIAALVRFPDSYQQLREEPELITSAVEELLRYDTPIQVAIRGALEQIEFQGRWIGPGHLLFLFLGAANRDPGQFTDPDRLDITRRPNRHLAFGLGPHGCAGGWLARFAMGIALSSLVKAAPRLQLAPVELKWHPPAMRRRLRSLPVSIDPAPLLVP